MSKAIYAEQDMTTKKTLLEMSDDIYAEPDMTTKKTLLKMSDAIYAEPEMTKKKTLLKMSEAIYAEPDMTTKKTLLKMSEAIYAEPEMTKKKTLLKMSEAIYAEPDMTKRFNRGEMEEKIVDIYISADTLRDDETSTKREETADTAPNNGPGDQHSEPDCSGKRPILAVTLCLGLLCLLLLAGIIGLSVHSTPLPLVSNSTSQPSASLSPSHLSLLATLFGILRNTYLSTMQ
ncbi:uncharacterized protein ACWYII_031278 isoform 3-T3 [Salvelinus alpinus]